MAIGLGTAAALALAAPTARAAGKLIPTKIDRYTRKRTKELQRLAEADALGLTGEEKEAMFESARMARQNQQRASEAQRRMLMAGFGAGSGEALGAAMDEEQAEAEAQQKVAGAVTEADMQRAAEQEQELVDLLGFRSQRSMDRRAAMADYTQEVADVALDELAFGETTGQDTIFTGMQKRRANRQLANMTGLSTRDASSLYESIEGLDPDFLNNIDPDLFAQLYGGA